MNIREFLMLMGVVTASAAGQLLLRRGAASWITDHGIGGFIFSFVKGPAPPALLLVLGAPLLYWKVLTDVHSRLHSKIILPVLLFLLLAQVYMVIQNN